MRLFILVLISLLLLFQYDFWFGKNGYLVYQKLTQEIEMRKQKNEKLFHRNQVLAAEIRALTVGFEAIEERARSEHKMVKSNEIFYRVVKEHK